MNKLDKPLNKEARGITQDELNKEKFTDKGRVHNWRNYVEREFIEGWKYLTERERKIIYLFAERQADSEEWD